MATVPHKPHWALCPPVLLYTHKAVGLKSPGNQDKRHHFQPSSFHLRGVAMPEGKHHPCEPLRKAGGRWAVVQRLQARGDPGLAQEDTPLTQCAPSQPGASPEPALPTPQPAIAGGRFVQRPKTITKGGACSPPLTAAQLFPNHAWVESYWCSTLGPISGVCLTAQRVHVGSLCHLSRSEEFRHSVLTWLMLQHQHFPRHLQLGMFRT